MPTSPPPRHYFSKKKKKKKEKKENENNNIPVLPQFRRDVSLHHTPLSLLRRRLEIDGEDARLDNPIDR